jgi:hypothetical protein
LRNCTDPAVGAALLSGVSGLDEVVSLNFAVTPAFARLARKSNLNLTLSVAQSPSSAQTLEALTTDSRKIVRRALSKNPNISDEAATYLFRWGQRKDHETAINALENPAFSPASVAQAVRELCIADNSFDYCGLRILRNLARSEEHLLWILKSDRMSSILGHYGTGNIARSIAEHRTEGPHIVDLLPGGALSHRIGSDFSEALARSVEREFSQRGSIHVDARLLRYVLDLESRPSGFYPRTLTVDAAVLGWEYSSSAHCEPDYARQLRSWVLRSDNCPDEITSEVLQHMTPVDREVGIVFNRTFGEDGRYSDGVEAAITMAERVAWSPVANTNASSIDSEVKFRSRRTRSSQQGSLGYSSAFALRVLRLASAESLSALIPYLDESDVLELARQPGGAFSADGPHEPKPRVIRVVMELRDHGERPGVRELLCGIRGVPPLLFFRTNEDHWACAHMVALATERFGSDADAWRTLRTLGPTWEGTLTELMSVIAKMCGTDTPTQENEPLAGSPLQLGI